MALAFEQALRLILAHAAPLAAEDVELDHLVGRIAAEDIAAPYAMPRWDNSEMDGFAVRTADCHPFAELSINGYLPAGVGAEQARVQPGTAVRIMTGAPIPDGCDAVVPVENTAHDNEHVMLKQRVGVGDYIRFRGSDMQAGEIMISAGKLFRPAEVNLLAAFSRLRAKVYRRPRIAILSTGDELVPPGQTPGPGQIIDSNSYSLAAAVRETGAEAVHLGIAKDNAAALRARISAGLQADILITSAGVSSGDRDLVREVLNAAGARLLFWKVNIKPSGPVAFALKGKTLIFSVPGNPVSSMIAFDQLIRPAILQMMGHEKIIRKTVTAKLSAPLLNETGKLRFLRVRVVETEQGLTVASAGDQNTGMLSTMIRAQGIVALPPECDRLEAGAQVEVQLFDACAFAYRPFERPER